MSFEQCHSGRTIVQFIDDTEIQYRPSDSPLRSASISIFHRIDVD